MTQPTEFDLPLAKANYLLNYTAEPGKGGDKQNFWQGEMGFETAEAIREAILAAVSLNLLQAQSQNAYGDLYRAYIRLTGATGRSRRIRTVWIARFNETVARFVTAVLDRSGGLQ